MSFAFVIFSSSHVEIVNIKDPYAMTQTVASASIPDIDSTQPRIKSLKPPHLSISRSQDGDTTCVLPAKQLSKLSDILLLSKLHQKVFWI